MLYGESVEEVNESLHLGIPLNIFRANTHNMTASVSIMRQALMAVIGKGADISGMSCKTAEKLYTNCIATGALYGCSELWDTRVYKGSNKIGSRSKFRFEVDLGIAQKNQVHYFAKQDQCSP